MTKSTTFLANYALTTGANIGFYDWNDSRNWSSGIPLNGDAVDLGNYSGIVVDDLPGLTSLTTLANTITGFATLWVATGTNLTVGSVTNASGTRTSFDVRGTLVDNSSTNTGAYFSGNEYTVENGGEIVVAAAPTATYDYYLGGTIAFEHPAATNSGTFTGVAGLNERLELPGTALNSIVFGGTQGITVTTNAGTYAFQNFYVDSSKVTYTSAYDASTGLEAITFIQGTAPPPDTTPPVIATDQTVSVAVGATAGISSSFLSSNDSVSSHSQLTYTVTTSPAYGTLLKNGTAVTSFTQSDIDNGLISYRENGAAVSADSFVFFVSDLAGNHTASSTFRFQIGASDTTAPVVVKDATLSLSTGGSATISSTFLSFSDAVSSHSQLTYTLVRAPGYGTLLRNGSAVSSFTQADIDNGLISYHENGSAVSADNFVFYVSDGAGNRSANTTFQFQINGSSSGANVLLNGANMWSSGTLVQTGSSQVGGGNFYYYSNVSNFSGYDITNTSVSSSSFVSWDSQYASYEGYFFDGNRVLADVYGSSANVPGVIRLTRHNSTAFDISSIALDTMYASSGVSVTFTGIRADHTTVTQTFSLDSVQGLQSFSFNSSFNDLTELDFAPSSYLLFDNASLSSALMHVSDDFNGDGVSDVLWQNSSTGDVGEWQMSAGHVGSWVALGNGTSPWSIAGTGDFNADGRTDVLWRNSTSGDVGYWQITNNGTTWIALGNGASPWQIVGVGDFNGDGISDVLWRNSTTGDVGEWQMANGHVASWVPLGNGAGAWQIAGIGDFNGDGTSDVLWRNTSTGDVGDWQMSNSHVAGWVALGNGASPWTIAGVGDFNDDGTSDVLWRNSSTGDVGDWLMANNHVTGWTALGNGATPWTVAGVGDYNGDGTSDVLWRNSSTGDVGDWSVTSNHVAGWNALGNGAGGWQMVNS